MSLTSAELRRYSRQMVMPEVGPAGQERLRESSVLLVGAGGLGSPAALYLAAAGVGRLGIVEFDVVDVSNLHRQVLYGEADLGSPKVEAAARRLRDLNPHVEIVSHAERLAASNAIDRVGAYDLVVDGSDNFPTRYLVNDACVLTRTPNVFGSVLRFEGQVSVFGVAGGPCYRCLFPEPPPPGLVPSCAEGGVFGVLPGIIGALQAHEAIKLLLGLGEPLIGRFLVFDGLALQFREIALAPNPECPVCSDEPTQTELVEYDDACAVDEASTLEDGEVPFDVSPAEVQAARARGEGPGLLDVRTPMEHSIARVEGARLLPLAELPQRFEELERDADLVVMCHHGIRSAQAVSFLRQQGFRRVRNLSGGIDAWSREVDDRVPRY